MDVEYVGYVEYVDDRNSHAPVPAVLDTQSIQHTRFMDGRPEMNTRLFSTLFLNWAIRRSSHKGR